MVSIHSKTTSLGTILSSKIVCPLECFLSKKTLWSVRELTVSPTETLGKRICGHLQQPAGKAFF